VIAVGRLRAHPWIAGGTAVVLAAGAGVGVWFGTRSDPAAAQATTRTETVATGTIRQSVSATGTLAPADEESLDFAVSGTVTHVWVEQGDRVAKGDVLATVDSAALAATVAQAKASVASAKTKVDDDETNDASDTQTAADQAALTAARNQLASARKQLTSAKLTSPIAGVVAEVNLTVGQSVSGNSAGGNSNNGASGSTGSNSSASSSSSAQVLVISEKSWIVNATVDATSVGLLKAGDQAQLTVDGTSQTLYGTIASIGLVSSSSSGTASYPVVVDVTGEQSGLHDGASVTATLIYKQLSNVIVIPTTALHRSSSGTYVEKVSGGRTTQATVQTGITSGLQVQITSGLSAGDTIVVPQLSGRTGSRNGSSTNRTRTGNFPGTGNFPAGGNFPGNFNRGGGGGGN
jgi:multidrug efflux pump subunit AcrA (membrane-fusion protein)